MTDNKWDIDYKIEDPMTKEEREAFHKMTEEEREIFLRQIIIPRIKGN